MADTVPKGNTKTVTVGCKLPHGLIIQHERLQEEKAVDGAVVRRYVPIGEPITLRGTNSSRVIGGFGLTKGVDGDFFRKWLADNKEFGPVKAGLIFASDDLDSASDIAEERVDLKSGFEPNNPDNLPKGIEPV